MVLRLLVCALFLNEYAPLPLESQVFFFSDGVLMQSMLGSSLRGLPSGLVNHEQTLTSLKTFVPHKHNVCWEGGQRAGRRFREGQLGAALATAVEL